MSWGLLATHRVLPCAASLELRRRLLSRSTAPFFAAHRSERKAHPNRLDTHTSSQTSSASATPVHFNSFSKASFEGSGGPKPRRKPAVPPRGAPKKPRAPPTTRFGHRSGANHSTDMSNALHVATTPTADTFGVGLVLHFDSRRYHFGNLAQGTQRSYTQRGLSMTKLEKFFLSGPVCWDNIGGLFGMMLTVADSLASAKKEVELVNSLRTAAGKPPLPTGDKQLEIYGGKNLTYAVATARNFVFRQGLPIKTFDLDHDPRAGGNSANAHDYSKPDWEDDLIQVWHVPVAPRTPENGTMSPRKRTYDDMMAGAVGSGEASSADAQPASHGQTAPLSEKQQQQRTEVGMEAWRKVVDAMFNSTWSKDNFVEARLGDVKLPAKLFVRDQDGRLREYQGPLPSESPDASDTKVWVREPWPAVLASQLPPTAASSTSLSYIVKNRGRRGKFNPKAAEQYGVAKVDYKKLTRGESVKGKDDVDVTPDMVLEAPMKGTGFAVLEIPSPEHIQDFIERPEWEAADLLDNVHVFNWVLGKGVFDDSRIQSFIKDRPSVRHLIMSPDVSPNMLAYESPANLLTKLRRIDPDRFPVLQFDNKFRDVSSLGPSVEVGRTGMKAILLPNYQFQDTEVVPFAALDGANHMDEGVLSLAREARQKISSPEFQREVELDEHDIPNRDAEIISLGTGSALPSKYRNVSGTLIRVPGIGNYLLDCGENTIGQLRRAFGDEECNNTIRDMRAIFISHMHADHHLGLVSFLTEWNRLTREAGQPDLTLTIIGPDPMQKWLNEYSCVEDIGLSRINYIRGNDVRPPPQYQRATSPSRRQSARNDPAVFAPSGLQDFLAVPVDHCHQAFAGVLTWPSGLKIAYSGDCRPSNAFAAAGRGATLLIHESTLDDDKREDAIAKKHSTMSEALGIGEKMCARRVLLTHFSQRYAKIPLLEPRTVVAKEDEEETNAQNGEKSVETEANASVEAKQAQKDQVVLMAFDQMRVKIGEFRHAAAFLPALKQHFDSEED